MAIKPLEKQHTGEQDLELFQNNIKDFVKVLEDNPLLDGHLIENVTRAGQTTPGLVAGDNTINHRLGRTLRGWIITRIYDPELIAIPVVYAPQPYIYDKQDANTSKDKTLVLYCDGVSCKIDLWVF